MQDGISTIITAIVNSRKIFRRLETYIIYRVASSLLLLIFFFFAIICLKLEMPTWVLVIISITNDLSVMATALDKVSPFPLFILLLGILFCSAPATCCAELALQRTRCESQQCHVTAICQALLQWLAYLCVLTQSCTMM